jgi:hypothetical protein
LETSELSDFYSKVGDSTEALIVFGKSLNETKEQSKAYHDSIAAQVLNNTNRSGWDENTNTIAGNLIDGNRSEVAYNEIIGDLAEVNLMDRNLSDDLV